SIKLLSKENVADLVIVQFKDVLRAGKEEGFDMSKAAYADAVERVDGYIGELVETIKKREDADYEEWLIIVTSSHGGVENSYGGGSFAERNVFSLYSYKYFQPQELKAETMEYVFLNGYFPGTRSEEH